MGVHFLSEERMRPGHWLGLVLFVPFCALTVMVSLQEGYLVHKKPIPLITRGFVLEQVEQEALWGNQLTQVYLEKQQ